MRPARDIARAVRRRVGGSVRRRTRSPFDAATGRHHLIHCSHHKVGTVWFNKVLREVAWAYGMRIRVVRHGRASMTDGDITYVEDAGRFERPAADGPSWRGSHLVRDPRDMAVSGYHYHLRTSEAWATSPAPRWGGSSYQDHLRSLPPHEGLMAEIERMAGQELAAVAAWDYDQPEFLELRYEDVLADEERWFTRLFRHYGFDERAVQLGVAAATGLSLHRGAEASGRAPGAAPTGHIRSGRPGQWQDHFTDEHTARFRELTGDLVERLGYH